MRATSSSRWTLISAAAALVASSFARPAAAEPPPQPAGAPAASAAPAADAPAVDADATEAAAPPKKARKKARAPEAEEEEEDDSEAPAERKYGNVRAPNWRPGDPVPEGYHAETEFNEGLVIAGGVTLGATWLLFGVLPGAIILSACSAFGANDTTCAAGGTLIIPAVGPFITMAFVNDSPAGYALLAMDGVVQSGGLVMLILGFALPDDVLVRNTAIGDTKIQIRPTVMPMGATGQGIGIVGSF